MYLTLALVCTPFRYNRFYFILYFFRFQETALEVFSSDGRNHFLVFPKPVRSKVYEK